MKLIRNLAGLLVLGGVAVTMAACGALKPDPALTLRTEEAYVRLVAGRDEALFNSFDKTLQTPALVETIAEMRNAVPPGQAAPPKLAGWEKFAGADGGKASVTLIYTYPDIPAFVTVEGHFAGSDKKGWSMDGFHVTGKRGAYEGPSLGEGTIAPPPVFRKEPAGS
jgi:hypothetical protein